MNPARSTVSRVRACGTVARSYRNPTRPSISNPNPQPQVRSTMSPSSSWMCPVRRWMIRASTTSAPHWVDGRCRGVHAVLELFARPTDRDQRSHRADQPAVSRALHTFTQLVRKAGLQVNTHRLPCRCGRRIDMASEVRDRFLAVILLGLPVREIEANPAERTEPVVEVRDEAAPPDGVERREAQQHPEIAHRHVPRAGRPVRRRPRRRQVDVHILVGHSYGDVAVPTELGNEGSARVRSDSDARARLTPMPKSSYSSYEVNDPRTLPSSSVAIDSP